MEKLKQTRMDAIRFGCGALVVIQAVTWVLVNGQEFIVTVLKAGADSALMTAGKLAGVFGCAFVIEQLAIVIFKSTGYDRKACFATVLGLGAAYAVFMITGASPLVLIVTCAALVIKRLYNSILNAKALSWGRQEQRLSQILASERKEKLKKIESDLIEILDEGRKESRRADNRNIDTIEQEVVYLVEGVHRTIKTHQSQELEKLEEYEVILKKMLEIEEDQSGNDRRTVVQVKQRVSKLLKTVDERMQQLKEESGKEVENLLEIEEAVLQLNEGNVNEDELGERLPGKLTEDIINKVKEVKSKLEELQKKSGENSKKEKNFNFEKEFKLKDENIERLEQVNKDKQEVIEKIEKKLEESRKQSLEELRLSNEQGKRLLLEIQRKDNEHLINLGLELLKQRREFSRMSVEQFEQFKKEFEKNDESFTEGDTSFNLTNDHLDSIEENEEKDEVDPKKEVVVDKKNN